MAKKVAKKKPLKTKKVAVTKGGETVEEIEIPISDNPEIQDGVSPRGKLGNKSEQGKATVGLSVGATLNMGDYQSARIDVFIQRQVDDNEESIKDGMEDISDLLHDELQRQSALIAGE